MYINEIPEAFSVKLRIKIIACLIDSSKTFKELMEITQATKGNLSVQLTKLNDWGYIISNKIIKNKKTKTTYTITPFGLNQFEEYVNSLQTIISNSHINKKCN